MKYVNINVLSAGDDVSQIGAKIDADQLVSASFQAYFGDSTAAGTVKIQASNDVCPYGYIPGGFTVTNWTDIPSATATVTAGASVLITLPQISYRWMRVVYTSSVAGSTTINVNLFAVAL